MYEPLSPSDPENLPYGAAMAAGFADAKVLVAGSWGIGRERYCRRTTSEMFPFVY